MCSEIFPPICSPLTPCCGISCWYLRQRQWRARLMTIKENFFSEDLRPFWFENKIVWNMVKKLFQPYDVFGQMTNWRINPTLPSIRLNDVSFPLWVGICRMQNFTNLSKWYRRFIFGPESLSKSAFRFVLWWNLLKNFLFSHYAFGICMRGYPYYSKFQNSDYAVLFWTPNYHQICSTMNFVKQNWIKFQFCNFYLPTYGIWGIGLVMRKMIFFYCWFSRFMTFYGKKTWFERYIFFRLSRAVSVAVAVRKICAAPTA
jgi:hypothetical protein